MAGRLLLLNPLRPPGFLRQYTSRAAPPQTHFIGARSPAMLIGTRWAGADVKARAMGCSSKGKGEQMLAPPAAVAAAKEDDMVYRKTVYEHGDWSKHRSNRRHSRHMLAIATSRVVAGLLPPVLKLTLVASALVLYNCNYLLLSGPFLNLGLLHVSSLPFQLAAPALALLLVFRTNASYGRFDEARKAWASIASRSRDMARQAVTFFRHPADAALLHHLLHHLVAFAYCVKDHLTREDDLQKELSEIVQLDETDLMSIMDSPHRPNYALQAMTHIIHNSHLSDMQKAVLDSNLVSLQDNMSACERIFTTPIPVSYTRLTSRILVIWHLLLPLALWDQCSWVTVPATFLSAAALFCIEEASSSSVGVLIEEPFSILPLASISNTIRCNVETILHQHKAMQAEALPFVESLKLEQDDGSMFPAGLPWIRYHGIHEGLDISVVVPGKCLIFGVDNVGTVPSALITYAAVQALHPDLIINMGTAGGFKAKGAMVADAYIATEAANHDRRIPIPIFDEYGIGVNTTVATPNLLQTLRLKEGKLSTGNSLDMTPQDEEIIKSNDATIKDMEL
ncbi:hypothetical protein L7F22_052553 [Adiantum nelumboides]|nr:hypothetical protein [Adiantum nelumboides]